MVIVDELNKNKKNGFLFCIVLVYSYLWLTPKELALDNKNEKKLLFILYCSRLFVPLHPQIGNRAAVSRPDVRESGENPELFLQL